MVDIRAVNCPRDNATLRQVVRKGTTIDVCTRCHGKWLDQGELEQLVLAGTRTGATADAVNAAVAAAERPSFFRAAGLDPEISCPRCAVAMQKVRFESGAAELTADRCETCNGFWLDSGETGALFVFLEEHFPIRPSVWAVVALALGLGLFAAYWLLAR